MYIETANLGTVDVAEEFLYTFPKGLYGLEDQKQFALILSDETLPFAYLQSRDEAKICLLVVNPFSFRSDYQFDLSEDDLQALQHPTEDAVAVWVTVSAKKSLQDATVNLLAPVILNTEKKIGRQVVLHEGVYETRTPLSPRQKEGA